MSFDLLGIYFIRSWQAGHKSMHLVASTSNPPSETRHPLLRRTVLVESGQKLLWFVVLLFLKTSIRHGTKNHLRNLSMVVLSPLMDPIGDQNDVQDLFTCLHSIIHSLYLVMFFHCTCIYTYIQQAIHDDT